MAIDVQRVERSDELALKGGEDVVRLRQAVRDRAVAVGFSLVDQTKIVTAASELARNAEVMREYLSI